MSLVDNEIAVVVHSITKLFSTRKHRRIQWRAVVSISHLVVIVVQVAGITVIVQVVILLFGVAHQRAIVLPVRDSVPVFVCFHAICEAVLVGVGKGLVGTAIAVVIQAVTSLRLRLVRIAHQSSVNTVFCA